MSEEKRQNIEVDENTKFEEVEKPISKRGVIKCAYCKQVFPNYVLVQKHIKICPSNPNNP